MTAFTNLDQIINALSVDNRAQRLWFHKLGAQTVTLRRPYSFWKGSGLPSAGSDPTTGMAGAATCDSSTAGALALTAPSGGRSLYLSYFAGEEWTTALGAVHGMLYLVDRLAHANISNNQATASFSPVLDGPARLGTGEGAQILMTVTSTLSGASNTRTFTYTNQDGTSGRTTKDIVTIASAAIGSAPYAESMFVQLQDGDTGVRSIEDTTLSSGTATGAYNIALVKVIAAIPIGRSVGLLAERDTVTDLPNLPVVADDACLSFVMGVGALAATLNIFGEVRLIEN